MKTVTTKRGKAVTLREFTEWWEWAYDHGFGGLVGLEQAYIQSRRHRVCAECLSTKDLVLQTDRALIKSTDYYECQECLDWWDAKFARDEALAAIP